MNDTTKLKQFLEKVSTILRKYEEIAKLTGENYNIFNILGLSTSEVRTHSAFIADLLNPDGLHGKGSIFLELFIKQLNLNDIEPSTSKVEVERHIGYINDDYTEGGNIDIIVEDKNRNSIIIENKIYAEDQKNQLLRYYNYGKEKLQNFHLYYLTLDGKEPSDWSLGGLSKDNYQLLSYETDILQWLQFCKKETTDFPRLRETLTQYINLIKQLTDQTMNDNMKEEIKNMILNDENIIDAIELSYDVFNEIIEETKNNFLKKLGNLNKDIFKSSDNLYTIKQYLGEDSDGFFIGFSAENNKGENVSNDTQFDNYRHNLKRILENKGYQYDTNHLHIGWYNPKLFTGKKKFKDLDKTEIIKMANDNTYLQKKINEIRTEIEEIEKELISVFERI